MNYIVHSDSLKFLQSLPSRSVDLHLVDPPYYGIVKDTWDNQWESEAEYSFWLAEHLREMLRSIKPFGSLILFQGVGTHDSQPIFQTVADAKCLGWFYRNWITWKKRRAYGKSHDYLFCREEILWFSRSPERTQVTFNIPLLDEKRGYAGWNEKYPAKSEYKRVSNVWDDIPELMRPERNCQKPEPLIERLVRTHSNPNDLVVDCWSGYGTTGIVSLKMGRRFMGSEGIREDAVRANLRCQNANLSKAV